MNELRRITKNHYPHACRKVFRNCDGWLTCSSLNYEYERKKCCYGKGKCPCRVNRWNISSSNQWSRGRNSGLLECCNIIDEYLDRELRKGGRE